MNDHDQLREQMWDLVYGLASADQTAALHARIKSDRAVARMYAEVSLEADLIAQAARVEDSSVSLPQLAPQREKVAAGRAKEAAATKAAGKPGAKASGPRWSLHWLGIAAASALAVLMAVGTFWRQDRLPREQAEDLVSIRIYNETDALVPGLEQDLEVESRDFVGRPISVPLTARFENASGEELYKHDFNTDESGHGQVPVPAQAIAKGNKVLLYSLAEVSKSDAAERVDGAETTPEAATAGDELLRELDRKSEPLVAAILPIRDEPREVRFTFDKEWYEPADIVRWRAVIVSAFTHQPQDVTSLHWQLTGRDGKALELASAEPLVSDGVVTGEFQLPAEAPLGLYAVTVQDSTRGQPQASALLSVGEESARSQSFSALDGAETANLERLSRFNLQRGLPGSAGIGLGGFGGGRGETESIAPTPAENAPRDIAPTKEGDSSRAKGPAVAGLPPVVSPKAARGTEPSQLAGAAPAPTGDDASPPPAAGSQLADQIVAQLEAAKKLSDVDDKKVAEHKVSVPVPPEALALGKRLRVEARQGGIVIQKLELPAVAYDVREMLDTNAAKELAGRNIELTVPANVDGQVEFWFFDNTVSPPQPIGSQLVQIAPRNEFNIALAGPKESYAPGETVRLQVQVNDPLGQPAPEVKMGLKVAPMLAVKFHEAEGLRDELGMRQLFLRQEIDKAGAELTPGQAGDDRAPPLRRKEDLADKDSPPERLPGLPGPAEPAAPTAPGLAPGGSGLPAGGPAGSIEERREDYLKRYAGRFADSRDAANKVPDDAVSAGPTLLADNSASMSRVLNEREANEAARQARFALWRARLGRWLLVGGVAMLLVLAFAVLVQRPAKARLWVPALAVAAASFAVGFVWILRQPMRESTVLAKREAPDAVSQTARPMGPAHDPSDMDALSVRDGEMAADAPAPAAPAAPPTDGSTFRAANGPVGGGERESGGENESKVKNGVRDEARDLKKAADEDGSRPATGSGTKGVLLAGDAPRAAAAAPGKDKMSAPAAKGDLPASRNATERAEAALPPAPSNAKAPQAVGGSEKRKMELDEADGKSLEKKQALNQVEDRSKAVGRALGEMQQAQRDVAKRGREGAQSRAESVWQPLLVADENGTAFLEFTMPDVPGDYKLVLDVHGVGRVGQFQTLIRCAAPPAAQTAPAADAKK